MGANQCAACGGFTTDPSGYCNLHRAQAGQQGEPADLSGGAIRARPQQEYLAPGVAKPRSDAEIGRTEHPDQRYVAPSGAQVRFGGRDPDIFDRMLALAAACDQVADDMKKFTVKDERTFKLIRSIRGTADDLRMEVEIRRGH